MLNYITRLAIACSCVAAFPALAGQLRWFDRDRPSAQANAVMEELRNADRYGLAAANYRLSLSERDLELLRANEAPDSLKRSFDEQLSAEVAAFMRHLEFGQVLAKDAGFRLPAPRLPEPMAVVNAIAQADDVSATIARHKPRPLPYALLEKALSRYRKLALDRPETHLAAFTRAIRPGSVYPDAPALRALLHDLGDLDATSGAATTAVFDPVLAAAVASFQRRHGLTDDGVIGKETHAALSVPLASRVTQIELTMERWRWIGVLGRPDIVVNIPQFMVHLLPKPDAPPSAAVEMPIIVGQSSPAKRTPVFTADLKYVVFQPYWDIPNGILRNELLPSIRKNPAYLERHHMELVDGQSDSSPVVAASPAAIEDLAAGRLRLRQRPGLDNPLGAVKFMLPNPYNVYLHGTPAVRLFDRAQRDFSHGCIRLSEPAVLAEFVLRNAPGDWNAAAIETAMCAPKTQRVNLSVPLKVLIFYGTAAATQTSGTMFFADIYGHDARLELLLDAANEQRRKDPTAPR